VVDAFIELSHVALCTSTGSEVIGVFQTLSLGKTGHVVLGSLVPVTLALRCDTAEAWLDDAKADGTANAILLASTLTLTTRAQ